MQGVCKAALFVRIVQAQLLALPDIDSNTPEPDPVTKDEGRPLAHQIVRGTRRWTVAQLIVPDGVSRSYRCCVVDSSQSSFSTGAIHTTIPAGFRSSA